MQLLNSQVFLKQFFLCSLNKYRLCQTNLSVCFICIPVSLNLKIQHIFYNILLPTFYLSYVYELHFINTSEIEIFYMRRKFLNDELNKKKNNTKINLHFWRNVKCLDVWVKIWRILRKGILRTLPIPKEKFHAYFMNWFS